MFSNAGTESFFDGLGGITGEYSSLFSDTGLKVALSFGLPTTIGLLSGTFGDQMFWQRVFCVKAENVKKTMLLAAVIFGIVPVSLSVFGFIAAGTHLEIADTQLVNVAAVIQYTPRYFLFLFFMLILAGLISTVDSILCATSSVAGHDVVERINSHLAGKGIVANPLVIARMAMILVAVIAVAIANIPGLTITYLFLFYGTLRSSVMLPTIFAINGKEMSERGLFYGILSAMCIGLPIFAYGNLVSNTALIVTGSLLTILLSGGLSRIIKNK